jgi:hypothetical protein
MLLVDVLFSNSSSIYKRRDKPKIPKFRYFLVSQQQNMEKSAFYRYYFFAYLYVVYLQQKK